MILWLKAVIPAHEERNHHGNSHPSALDIETYQDERPFSLTRKKKSCFNKTVVTFKDTYSKINIVNHILKFVTHKVTKVRNDGLYHIPTFLHSYLMDPKIIIKLRFELNIANNTWNKRTSQHKCSDQCNCDRSFEEAQSNTKGLGLLVHTAARSSWDQGLLWLLPVNFAKTGSVCVCVFRCQPGDCFSIPNSILLYFSWSLPSFERQP